MFTLWGRRKRWIYGLISWHSTFQKNINAVGYCCYVSNHINTGGLQCMPASNDFTAFAYFVAFYLCSIFHSIIFLLFRISGLFSSFLQYFDAIVIFVVIFDRSFPICFFFPSFFLFAIPVENDVCEWMIKAIVLIKFVKNDGSAGCSILNAHTSEWNAILTLWCWWWLWWLFSIHAISKWNTLIYFSHSKKQ